MRASSIRPRRYDGGDLAGPTIEIDNAGNNGGSVPDSGQLKPTAEG